MSVMGTPLLARCSVRVLRTASQLRQEFEANTGQVWPLNVGQVYTTLQRLERDGLVTAIGDGEPGGEPGPQKAYRITGAGSDELAQWLRVPPDLSTPPRDDLVMKVLIAVRVPDTDVSEIIQAHRWPGSASCRSGPGSRGRTTTAGTSRLFLVVDSGSCSRIDSAVRWLDAAGAGGCAGRWPIAGTPPRPRRR